MNRKKATPWFTILASIGTGLTIVGVIFGNVMAWGKQQAKTEQVEKDVASLKEDAEEQAKELDGAQSDQKLIQKDVEVIRNNMVEQKVLLNQVLEAVTRKK
mgnify:CR=1 FL=1